MSHLPSRWRCGDVAVALCEVAATDGGGRRCLAELLNRSEGEIRICRDSGRGKPSLAGLPGAVFNMAHCDGFSLIGAGWSGAIGVDLETLRPDLDTWEIAEALFHPAEAAWLRALSPRQRCLGFTALWTIKEAMLKATGRGIAGGLQSPMVDGETLKPFLGEVCRMDLVRPEATVELRRGMIGDRSSVACVVRMCEQP